MSNAKHFTDSLSQYIDGALNPAERARIDAHLAVCAQCRTDLAELRYVVSMTRALPPMRAPRSFTLSPEMVGRTAHPWRLDWLYTSLRGFTAIAAVLLVLVCSADFLSINRLNGSASAPVPAVMSLPESSQTSPGAADQATNQSKSVTAAPAAPAGAAPAATAAPATTALPAAGQTPHVALPAQAAVGTTGATAPAQGATTGTPGGTTRSASAATTATAVPTVTVTAAPSAAPSVALSVTITLFPTAPLPSPTSAAQAAPQEVPYRPAEIGLLGALLLCGAAALVLRSTRR